VATKIIKKAEVTELISRVMEHYRVYAPVRRQEVTDFQQITGANQVDLSLANTTLSPKSLMLPQSEPMFEFTLDKDSDRAGVMQEIEKDSLGRVIFGIRPCDAKAFQLLDLNFDTPAYRDPWWAHRRQHTTLVGLGCNDPCSTCFCTSVGSGPFSPQGLDLLLTDMGDQLTIEVISGKGKQLVEQAAIEGEASETTVNAVAEHQQASERTITSAVFTHALEKQSLIPLFDADFWDEVQFACINCGVCTFVCPTCWCFDIQDEVHKNVGVRLRNWDACMFPLFTLHGSGHNPRSQKLQRVRQRFMHKLKYFPDKYDNGVACVGCGRCIRQCPVNIDIREVFRLMNEFEV
jgi:ferredoxin